MTWAQGTCSLENGPSDCVKIEGDRAVFFGKFSSGQLSHLQLFLNRARQGQFPKIILDFAKCTRAYPNSMLPLIAAVHHLLSQKIEVNLVEPLNQEFRNLFLRTNWAHFLAPDRFNPTDDVHERHLCAKNFSSLDEQQEVVDGIIDVVMRSMKIDRSYLSGLEWSVNEITDNVLNHSYSSTGGFAQLTTYTGNNRLAFCVADSGRGILDTLREGFPQLHKDTDAIADAVRAGITRNSEVGQGNGLWGSLRIAMAAGGSFTIRSGCGSLQWNMESLQSAIEVQTAKRVHGTIVDVQLPLGAGIDLEAIFEELERPHGNPKPKYADAIELKYLSDDCRTVSMRMSTETTGFGTRAAGAQMRTKAKNLMAAEPQCPLIVNFEDVHLVSSSFADEFIGKLFVELGPLVFMSTVRISNTTSNIKKLLDLAILQRTHQAMTRRI